MNEKTRRETIFSLLKKTYPRAKIALSYRTPWELLVAVILSAQCTDVMVNKVTKILFTKYKTLDDYCSSDVKIFEQDIKSTGFYHNKTKHIIEAAKRIKNSWGGEVPKTMEGLLTLPGVARKTANVVLGNAYGIVEGIAVDTHVIRLSQRLRLISIDKIGGTHPLFLPPTSNLTCPTTLSTVALSKVEGRRRKPWRSGESLTSRIDFVKDADPVKIEKELMEILPKSQWFLVTYELIDHGRAICTAIKPKCTLCPLAPYCPTKRG